MRKGTRYTSQEQVPCKSCVHSRGLIYHKLLLRAQGWHPKLTETGLPALRRKPAESGLLLGAVLGYRSCLTGSVPMIGFAFEETDEAAAEITRLFDFVWPTAVALWNLRWQVDGFLSAVPGATYENVASRFVVGSEIHGADIRAMTTRTTWEDQKTRFSDFILINVFAIYEGWARSLLKSTGVQGISDRELYREKTATTPGLPGFVARVNSAASSVMQTAFQPTFSTHKKVLSAHQSSMLKCYKYFKEVRNCQIHNNGLADQKLVNAFLDFHPISSASSMQTKEDIEHFSMQLGERTKLSLRGVVGFCDIVLRLMITTDAEISGSKAAETAALNRMRKGLSSRRLTMSANPTRQNQQIRKVCRNGNLPPPLNVSVVRQILLEQGLISI